MTDFLALHIALVIPALMILLGAAALLYDVAFIRPKRRKKVTPAFETSQAARFNETIISQAEAEEMMASLEAVFERPSEARWRKPRRMTAESSDPDETKRP